MVLHPSIRVTAPFTPAQLRRLVFTRWLATTARLSEYPLGDPRRRDVADSYARATRQEVAR